MNTNLEDIIVLDNLLPESYVQELEKVFTDQYFPWFYHRTISYGDKTLDDKFINHDEKLKDTDAFIHGFLLNGQRNSEYFGVVRPILFFLEKHLEFKINNILRIRGVFVNKNPGFGDYINIPHVDIEMPHTTMIYYINDSDGDTIIFEEKFKDTVDCAKKTEAFRVSPKRGRIVVFDGTRYHTGSVPKVNNRMLINFNFN
jgi:hypothetical protein